MRKFCLFSSLFGCLNQKQVTRKTFLVTILIANLLFSLIVFCIYNAYFACGHSQADEAISNVCDSYREGKALGNMCHNLCVLKDIRPAHCQPIHLGKDVVFVASWQGANIMMKASRIKAEQYDPIYWTDNNGNFGYPNEKTFHDILLSSTKWNSNMSCYSSKDTLLEKIWTLNLTRMSELSNTVQHVAMNNIWSLVQQPEYLFSKCLEDKNLLPKIIGSCGHMYAVEYIPPLPTFMHILYPTWKEDFTQRAEWARLLIKLVEKLDSINNEALPLGTLHVCDVKINHFGFDGDQIKLLDADMIFFEPNLISNIKLVNRCSHDKDCSFIDCESECDIVTNRCSPVIKDNNLKRICRNVFSGRIMQHFGLLSSPPNSIAEELHRILSQCSEANSEDTKEQLLELLNKEFS